jgi:hypothetical protein
VGSSFFGSRTRTVSAAIHAFSIILLDPLIAKALGTRNTLPHELRLAELMTMIEETQAERENEGETD